MKVNQLVVLYTSCSIFSEYSRRLCLFPAANNLEVSQEIPAVCFLWWIVSGATRADGRLALDSWSAMQLSTLGKYSTNIDRFLSRHHCYSWIASLSGSGNVFFPFSSHRIWPSGFPFSDACVCPSGTWWMLSQQKWLPAFPGSLWFSCSFWDHGLPICIPCRQHPNPVVSICLHHQIWFLCQHTIPICLHHFGWPPL